MANKEQLRKVANNCSHYNFETRGANKLEANVLGETISSCENCSHFTEAHQCNIDLIDPILSNLPEVDYE